MSFLVSFIAGFVISFLFTLVWRLGSGSAVTPDWISTTHRLVSLGVSTALSFFVLRWAILSRLDKDINGLRLTLVGSGETN